jgi:predicted lysophospholipase L1 biosynthesis ABC-type transport system permease subunit
LLNETDVDGSPRVAVISEEMARRYWPDENPLGAVFTLGSGRPREVVGVVSGLRQYRIHSRPFPAAFLPYAQAPAGDYHVMLKTRSVPLAAVPTLRAVAHDLDPELAVYGVETLEGRVAENVANPRFLMLLATAFAVIATILAATGVYGVLAYSVSQRTREIGIRMALGARKALVLRSVLFQGLGLAGAAVVFGLPLAYAMSRTMRRMLFQIGTADPITFGAIIVLVFSVSIVACYFPAAQAASSDPLKALRLE